MAPRPAEAPWQVASWCDEASSRRQVVLTVCDGKAWWPNCATVLRCSLVLMYRACKLTRGAGEDDRTENKAKIRKVVFYRRFSPVLERPRAAQVELDGQVNGRMISLTCVLRVRMAVEPQSQKANLHVCTTLTRKWTVWKSSQASGTRSSQV